jgi:hypothetical protein
MDTIPTPVEAVPAGPDSMTRMGLVPGGRGEARACPGWG